MYLMNSVNFEGKKTASFTKQIQGFTSSNRKMLKFQFDRISSYTDLINSFANPQQKTKKTSLWIIKQDKISLDMDQQMRTIHWLWINKDVEPPWRWPIRETSEEDGKAQRPKRCDGKKNEVGK